MDNELRKVTHVENVRYDKAAEELVILDQTLLPNEEKFLRLTTAEEMYDAIKTLKVRGAPAIGICAAYSMYVLARSIPEDADFYPKLEEYGAYLNSSRPTAVNLSWAIREMLKTARENLSLSRPALLEALYEKAAAIHADDIAKCAAISEYGLTVVKDGDGILTHCNAGPLATSRYGTALGPILLGTERGMKFRVFSDETRPLLQGARLTSYELFRAGVDVQLICDNMASLVMKSGKVQACFVCCDRIAASGDFANKIGTYSVAVLAKHHGIPFYTVLPSSTIDLSLTDGSGIPVEERSAGEVRALYGVRTAPEKAAVWNPAFDVTPHELLTGIITEKGVIYPPFRENLARLFG